MSAQKMLGLLARAAAMVNYNPETGLMTWRRGEFVTDPSEHLLRPVDGCIVWAHEIEGAQG